MAKRKGKGAQAARQGPPPPRRWPRRLGLGLAAVAVLAGLGAGVRQLLDPQTLPVRSLELTGRFQHIAPEAVRQAVRPYTGDGLLRLDIDAVRRAVQGLAWVRSASVRRAWPDAVAVRVTEHQAVARWAGGGLINGAGERFMPSAADGQGLPVFEGPAGTVGELTRRYREMQRALSPLGLSIGRVALDARRSWRLRLEGGVELVLGRDRQYERLLRFVRVYGQALAERKQRIERVDLRYTNGLAVRWQDDEANG